MDMQWAARLRYSDVRSATRSPERYFELLGQTDNGDAAALFAVINDALLFLGQLSSKLHADFEAEFLDDELRVLLREHRSRSDGPLIVFSRPLSLLSIKVLLGGGQQDAPAGPLTNIGELAIHGNDFVDSPDTFWEGDPDLLEIVCEFAPVWDLSNPRNINQLFVRTYLLLTTYLPENDGMARLIERVFSCRLVDLTFDGLVLDDYLALVFGVYHATREAIQDQSV